MKLKECNSLTSILVGVVLAGCTNTETDGAMYRGNLERTGVYASDGPRQLNELVWKFKAGVWPGSPVVSGGMVYFGSPDGHLYAVDLKTGQEKWEFKTGAPVHSSPAVSGGMVYFGSLDGHLYAVDLIEFVLLDLESVQ